MICITLKKSFEDISRVQWQAFLACTARIRVLDMTEDHLSYSSLRMLRQLIDKYGGPIFPTAHTVINLSCCKSKETFEVVASPCATHVELTDYKIRFNWRPDDILQSIARKNPDVRLLTICGLSSYAIDVSPFQTLLEFRCHADTFGLEVWVGLSTCPLLEDLWLSFQYGGLVGWDPGGLQPLIFPALKQLLLAMEGGTGLAHLIQMSAMPRLSRAVFLTTAELDLESRDELIAHLRSISPSMCDVEIGDNPGKAGMRRSLLSVSNQLFSNGVFGLRHSSCQSDDLDPDSEENNEGTGSTSYSGDETDV